jgi:hypothetical protein
VKATRRGVLGGALAVPAVAGMPRLKRSTAPLLVHDPALAAGRRLAETHAGEVLAIEGDPIRFARALFARRPSLVVGVSRHADGLLIEEVGREAGYVPVPAPASLGASGWVLAPRGNG